MNEHERDCCQYHNPNYIHGLKSCFISLTTCHDGNANIAFSITHRLISIGGRIEFVPCDECNNDMLIERHDAHRSLLGEQRANEHPGAPMIELIRTE
jgi:hypothetical protein